MTASAFISSRPLGCLLFAIGYWLDYHLLVVRAVASRKMGSRKRTLSSPLDPESKNDVKK
jgi:hypothetical protein